MTDALNTQVGGNHYAKMKYQPIEFAMKCQLNPVQFSIAKYVSRYKNKNGLQDLAKALHFCEIAKSLDTDPIEDDIHWLVNEIYRYVHDNCMSELQDLAVSMAATKQYDRCARFVRMMMDEN